MHELGHKLGDTFRGVVNIFSSTPTESQFVEKGVLTPAEFVEAGDQLVFKFPTWQWQSAPDGSAVSYLPKDKQYLVTRNVPCTARVKDLDEAVSRNRQEGDWCLPGTLVEGDSQPADIPDIGGATWEKSSSSKAGGIEIQDDFIQNNSKKPAKDLDFSVVDNLLVEVDPAKAVVEDGYVIAQAPEEDNFKVRNYDLHISYDKYYQTPRLWLSGFIAGMPLNPQEVFEDVLSAYQSKTVTVDPHPFTRLPTASIHPCKHAQVMKKVVDDWVKQGITPRVDLALFVFLKFISSVVPTVNYDFTMDIEF
eukprot:GEMP01068465.1.p1 GENE.GEMP01068465.1~~GEMP01068465.1.p1  ORF type:complete len:306 (+),score=56.03 GEMP01068465.1:199-1116(+)